MSPPKVTPLGLQEVRSPFDDPDWLFEVKHDGFRSLAYIGDSKCELMSRNGHVYKRFGDLRAVIPADVSGDAIQDGEIVVLDSDGRTLFSEVMRSTAQHVAAFDLLWLNGEDLRELPLIERKKRLKKIVRRNAKRVLYVDHVEEYGKAQFAEACKRDVEGIVAKPLISPYRNIAGRSPWIKIRNPKYSQKEGRAEEFNKRH